MLEKDCPQSVKDSVAENVKDWMQKRGEKELQVLAEHFPQQYQKKVYQQFRQKYEEYTIFKIQKIWNHIKKSVNWKKREP